MPLSAIESASLVLWWHCVGHLLKSGGFRKNDANRDAADGPRIPNDFLMSDLASVMLFPFLTTTVIVATTVVTTHSVVASVIAYTEND